MSSGSIRECGIQQARPFAGHADGIPGVGLLAEDRDGLAVAVASGPEDPSRLRACPVLSRARLYWSFLTTLAVFAALAALTDWDAPEFGRHPDEAAHFSSGTLVHDWAAGGIFRSPVDYALQYYARYPKVAIGHWPPVFYILQGVWYGLFGVSRTSSSILMAAISGGFLLTLFGFLTRGLSRSSALLAVSLVLASPVFRYVSSEFLADTLVAMISLGALWCYAIYLESGRLSPALGFGALSALAILTKQDAIVLGAVPPVSVLLYRRWGLLRDWRFYAPAVVVLGVCMPYHFSMVHATTSAWSGMARMPIPKKLEFLLSGFSLAGAGGLMLAFLGAAAAAAESRRSVRAACLAVVLIAHAIGVAAVQVMTPVSLDPRYRTALLPLAAFLAASAFRRVLALDLGSSLYRVATVAGLAGLLIAGQPSYRARKVSGYRQAVGRLTERPGLQVVLVCSDPMGDGAVVAEFRLQHPSGRFCVIRADKVLASSTWMNRNYRLVYESPQEIEDYFVRQPVHFVLIDDWGANSGEHSRLLNDLLESRPGRFPLEGSFPIVRRITGEVQRGTARLYRVAANADVRPDQIELQIPGLPHEGRIKATADSLQGDR
jgi:hypothetical protein